MVSPQRQRPGGLLSSDPFPVTETGVTSIEPITTIDPKRASVTSYASREGVDVCEAISTEPSKDSADDVLVVIDANTGKILEGNTHVSEDTRVKVAFVNKNPFKYDYNFELIPKDIGGATVVSFLGLIPGLPAIPGVFGGTIEPAITEAALKAGVDRADSAARERNAARALGEDPAQCAEYAKKIEKVVANGVKIAKVLNEEAELLKKTNEEYTKFLKATDKTPKGGSSGARIREYKALCAPAAAVLPRLQDVLDVDVDDFSKNLKLDVFTAQVTVLEAELNESGCDDIKKNLYVQVIAGLKQAAATYKTRLDEFKKVATDTQKVIEPAAKIIKAALGSSTSFAEAAYAPTLGDATRVSVSISRKNLREANPKEEKIAASSAIEIGEPRVVLSGGVGFSTINERKIIRQQSLVPDANGAMVLGNRFGFENRSQFRPSGIILINGLLKRFSLFGNEKATLAISGGLVFSNRNDGLATEFIGGPSLGLANNKVFLTFGFHAARVEELSGGFKIGDPVPADLTDPLPLQKNWRNGLMFGLTFKVPTQ
jgi:hypothetical protein